jgi:hypothetical protein
MLNPILNSFRKVVDGNLLMDDTAVTIMPAFITVLASCDYFTGIALISWTCCVFAKWLSEY